MTEVQRLVKIKVLKGMLKEYELLAKYNGGTDYDRWKALDMAIQVLEQEPNKWIPTSERLPEDKQSVLVWCPQYKNIYCAYHEKEQWWIFGAFVQIVQNEVIAWMPLPEPYKAESEDKE